jgi:hypothetical protein
VLCNFVNYYSQDFNSINTRQGIFHELQAPLLKLWWDCGLKELQLLHPVVPISEVQFDFPRNDMGTEAQFECDTVRVGFQNLARGSVHLIQGTAW